MTDPSDLPSRSRMHVRVMRFLNRSRIGNTGMLGRIGPRLVEWYFWRFVYEEPNHHGCNVPDSTDLIVERGKTDKGAL